MATFNTNEPLSKKIVYGFPAIDFDSVLWRHRPLLKCLNVSFHYPLRFKSSPIPKPNARDCSLNIFFIDTRISAWSLDIKALVNKSSRQKFILHWLRYIYAKLVFRTQCMNHRKLLTGYIARVLTVPQMTDRFRVWALFFNKLFMIWYFDPAEYKQRGHRTEFIEILVFY